MSVSSLSIALSVLHTCALILLAKLNSLPNCTCILLLIANYTLADRNYYIVNMYALSQYNVHCMSYAIAKCRRRILILKLSLYICFHLAVSCY